jgi:hypothetical protein
MKLRDRDVPMISPKALILGVGLAIVILVLGGIAIFNGWLASDLKNQESEQANEAINDDQPSSVDQNTEDQAVESTVFTKEGFEFNYYPPDKRLYYTGSVEGANGCARLGQAGIKQQDDQLLFQVTVNYVDDVCTQATKQLLVQGYSTVSINDDQVSTLSQSTTITIVQNN